MVGKANSGPSKKASAIPDQCQPTRVMSDLQASPAAALDHGPVTGKVQMKTEPAVMHNGKLSAQPHSLLSQNMSTSALVMRRRVCVCTH